MTQLKPDQLDTLRFIADKIGLKYYNDHDNQRLLISDGTVDGCREWNPYDNAYDAVEMMKSVPMIVKAERGVVMVNNPDLSGIRIWQYYNSEDDRDRTIRSVMVAFAVNVLHTRDGFEMRERGITK